MATNMINTRIRSKYDTLNNWIASAQAATPFIPLQGEICVVEIPNTNTSAQTQQTNQGRLTPPAISIKVGDGTHNFLELPWIQGLAGDIYGWAKQSSIVNDYTRTDLENLVSGQIQDTDTVYRIIEGTGSDVGKYFLQSKAKAANDNAFTTVSTIDLSSVQNTLEFDGTYDASTNKVATQSTVTTAISGLTDTLTGTPGAGKTITAFDEVNGQISATFSNISITRSQISDAGTAAGATVATTAIVDSDSSTDLPTKAQVASYVDSKTAGLSGAMHYKGEVAAIPPASGTYVSGDVVLLTDSNKEYIYDGTNWKEFGDEGSYALKTITVTGTDGLTGGGSLESNRTISHAVPSGAAASTKGTSGGRDYIQTITTDKFGHITGVTTATEIVTDTTYTFAEGTTDGAFSVTPTGGTAQTVSIHGLGDAAYADVASAIDNSTNASKLATAGQVAGVVNGLSGSAIATAANGNVYTVLTGVTETNGIISKTSEVTLAAIAKTGSIYDVIEHNTVTENSSSVNYLIFDCGDASHLITDPT